MPLPDSCFRVRVAKYANGSARSGVLVLACTGVVIVAVQETNRTVGLVSDLGMMSYL